MIKGSNQEKHEIKTIFERFLEPRSIAIVGASQSEGRFGNTIIRNLTKLNFKGRIYAVNPQVEDILGFKAYPSIRDIPEPVDLAIFIIKADRIPDILEECIEKDIHSAIILSSGFEEIGGKGNALQEKVLEIAERGEIRILGPNTTGILNARYGFTTGFAPLNELKEGSVSFVVQSGIFAGMMYIWISSVQNFGIGKVIGLGNKCDIHEADALEYLMDDTETKVIVMYLEGIKDGRRFFNLAKRSTKVKPLLVLKSGTTQAGSVAALSHTGTIAGNDKIFDAVCKQIGITRLSGFDDLIDITKVFALQRLPEGNRVAVVTVTGAGGVVATDRCVSSGLRMAEPSPATVKKIKEVIVDWASVNNPIDIPRGVHVGDITTVYRVVFRALLEDEGVDALLFNLFMGEGFTFDVELFYDRGYASKPLVLSLCGEKYLIEDATSKLESRGIPVYNSVDRAVKSLSAITLYAQRRRMGKNIFD